MASPAAALQVIRRTTTVEWPTLSEKEARKLLVATAQAGHKQIMADAASRSGVIPTWIAYGDTQQTPIAEAKKTIVFKYTYLREMVLVIVKALQDASPVASGRYRNAHTLFIDRQAVPLSTPILAGQEVFISNPLPYARRLEIGKTESGRNFLISVPNRIYERVAGAAKARYRNAANISFGYITPSDAHVIQGKLGSHYIAKGGARRRRRQEVGAEVRSPAIFIGSPS